LLNTNFILAFKHCSFCCPSSEFRTQNHSWHTRCYSYLELFIHSSACSQHYTNNSSSSWFRTHHEVSVQFLEDCLQTYIFVSLYPIASQLLTFSNILKKKGGGIITG